MTGVQRFASSLALQIKTISPEAVFVCPEKIIHSDLAEKLGVVKFGKLNGHLWEQLELPKFCGRDLLINLCNTGPAFKRNQIIFIHDAAIYRFPKSYKLAFVLGYKVLNFFIKHSAKKIFTVSQFSKNEIIECLGINGQKIEVISPIIKIDAEEDPNILNKLDLKKDKYILAVGSLDPKKNLQGAIKAYSRINTPELDLVIVGGSNANVFNKIQIPKDKKIKLSGFLKDEELVALYKHAMIFIFPSFYEGFGLPPLEAMLFGCPVLSSNRASLPEVCGDAALYCDPTDDDSIFMNLSLLVSRAELRDELRQKGKMQARKFCDAHSAKKILAAISVSNSSIKNGNS